MPLEKDIKFRSPKEVKRIMARAMNDVLQGKSNKSYGILSSLGNTWLQAHKLEYELGEFAKLKEQFEKLKLKMADEGPRRWRR